MAIKTAKCACEGGTLIRFIQPYILSFLACGEDYGYNIIQRLEQTRIWDGQVPDASGVYRTLKSMEQRGLVHSYIATSENSTQGRRVYSITPAGIKCMASWESTLIEYRKGIDDIIDSIQKIRA